MLDDNQKRLNERYDQLRTILETLQALGVTDKDFDIFPLHDMESSYHIAAALEKASDSDIDEALDLCDVFNSMNDSRRWPFRRRPKDQTTKALIHRLMTLYLSITGT